MDLIGGHPDLLQQAFSAMSHGNINLEQLLKLASTEEGIYRSHLHQQLWNLQQHSQLKAAHKQVVTAKDAIPLNTEVGFKLHQKICEWRPQATALSLGRKRASTN